jgi:hypothetical protein
MTKNADGGVFSAVGVKIYLKICKSILEKYVKICYNNVVRKR